MLEEFIRSHEKLLFIAKLIIRNYNKVIFNIKTKYPQYLLLNNESYLKEVGWYKSVKKQIPINKISEPIPWYTYSLIDFLQTRLSKDMNIFEYGSGYSTIWWAKYVKKVISCEHDKEWIEKLKPFSENVEISFKDIENEYGDFILEFKDYFDVIVIDGVKRDICSKNCLQSLKSSGVIIHDDTDNPIYEKNCLYFKINGYKRLDFWGMKPSTYKKYCTSIFYKENNCLSI